MDKVSQKQKYFWNMMGSLSNSFSSLILSVCVNRILGGSSGGLFTFAYSNAQLMLTVGIFEVRLFQSTDVKEKYDFNTYYLFRLITCGFSIIASLVYICISNFTVEKGVIVFLLVMFKMVEAFTDVYGGRFQQKDRIDLSGKIFFVRVLFSTIVFLVLLLVCNDLKTASLGMFITSFMLFFVYDRKYIDKEERRCHKAEWKKIFSLFTEVFPLFICAFIIMYINNAPKYAINSMYSDEIQNIYGILFMPAFVINLFSIFIFRPLLVNMALSWNEKKIKALCRIIVFMYICIVGITIIALIGTAICGIPLLSLLYNIDLTDYKSELLVVMLTGGLSALMSFSSNVITIMRKTKWLLAAYIVVFVYSIICIKGIIEKYAIMGAVLSYGIAVGLLVILFNCIIVASIICEKYKNSRKCR